MRGLAAVVMLTLLLAGCSRGGPAPVSPSTESARTSATTSSTVLAAPVTPETVRGALGRAGIDVGGLRPLDRAPDDGGAFFGPSAEPLTMSVGGSHVTFYEFPSSEEASLAASRVSPDGSLVPVGKGVAAVEWVGAPHFFRSAELIVVFIENNGAESRTFDSRVINVLRNTMGDEFAGRGSWGR